MTHASIPGPSIFRTAFVAICCALVTLAAPLAQSQTLNLLHKFQNLDGAHPDAGLTIDAQGRLYGTTSIGGPYNRGEVFRLSHVAGGWVQDVLYQFTGETDGGIPVARVIFGPDGTLYGTTAGGGDPHCGCGVVFRLQPPPTACKTPLCPWTETVLHTFEGTSDGDDGDYPASEVSFDSTGNLYGTTTQGGQYNYGMAYRLTKTGGGWTETNVHNFTIFEQSPYSSLTIDANGNLYGTTPQAYPYSGEVYELSPSGGGWTEQVLHYFQQSDGGYPVAGVIFDAAGNLYGATTCCGANNGGTAFELSPSNGGWSFSVLYNFTGSEYTYGGPHEDLAFDASGNLFGTTVDEGSDSLGNVFELSPSGGSWSYTSLYDFSDQYTAANPSSNVVFDSSGNLYGTTTNGGPPYYCSYGCGTVWQIMP